ncbi:hypothetical protein IJT17_08215 [bacterium]|nr:hypothetical protein [bacterium]
MGKLKRPDVMFWLITAFVYELLVALYLVPSWQAIGPCYAGIDGYDFFHEICLNYDVQRYLLSGQLPCFSDLWAYPNIYSLLGGFKSYLHTLFSLPFMAVLPWPHWWNMTVAFTLWCNALLTAWALYLVSRQRLGSALLGALSIFCEWNCYATMKGHLVQMWYGPILAAIALLYINIWEDRESDSGQTLWPLGWQVWMLGAMILASALDYWLNGMYLLGVGLLMLAAKRFKLTKVRWQKLILISIGILCIVMPLGQLVLEYSEDIIDLELYSDVGEGIYGRSFYESLGFPMPRKEAFVNVPLCTPAVAGLAALVALLGWTAYSRRSTALWMTMLLGFTIVAMGPYLYFNDIVFCQNVHTPLRLPMFYLVQEIDFLSRWQQPNTVTPIVMFSLYALALQLWPYLQGTGKRLVYAWSVWLVVCGWAVPWPHDQLMHNAHVRNVNPDLKDKFYPAIPHSPFYAYPHLYYLRSLPQGSVIDMPLFFVPNSWHFSFLHEHPTLNAHPNIGNLIINYPETAPLIHTNLYLLYLLQGQLMACSDYHLAPPPLTEITGRTYGFSRPIPREDSSDHLWNGTLAYLEDAHDKLKRGEWRTGLQSLENMGFRYILLHRSSCEWMCPGHGREVYAKIKRDLLEPMCGKPLFEDGEAAIYALPTVSGSDAVKGSQS